MKNDLKDRTKIFALRTIKFCSVLPSKPEFWVISKQLIRCSSSVGANYRAACRGRSKPDFIAKLGIVEEEADEAIYWMELLAELGYKDDPELEALRKEADELVAIIVSSKKTARANFVRT